MSKSKSCRDCRILTDLLIASYTLKDLELSNAVLRSMTKHAAKANHKPSEGWVLVGGFNA